MKLFCFYISQIRVEWSFFGCFKVHVGREWGFGLVDFEYNYKYKVEKKSSVEDKLSAP